MKACIFLVVFLVVNHAIRPIGGESGFAVTEKLLDMQKSYKQLFKNIYDQEMTKEDFMEMFGGCFKIGIIKGSIVIESFVEAVDNQIGLNEIRKYFGLKPQNLRIGGAWPKEEMIKNCTCMQEFIPYFEEKIWKAHDDWTAYENFNNQQINAGDEFFRKRFNFNEVYRLKFEAARLRFNPKFDRKGIDCLFKAHQEVQAAMSSFSYLLEKKAKGIDVRANEARPSYWALHEMNYFL